MGSRRMDPALLRKLLDHAPALVLLIDDQARIQWVNEPAAELFGFDPDEVIGENILDHLDADWDPLAFESIATAMGGAGVRLPMLFRVMRADGSKAIVEVTANAQMDDPVLGGMVVYARRWDERYLFDQALEAMAASRPLSETLGLLVRIAEAETLDADAAILYDPTFDEPTFDEPTSDGARFDGPRLDGSTVHQRRGRNRFAGAISSDGLASDLVGPTGEQSDEVAAAWDSIIGAPEGRVHGVDDLPDVLRGPAAAAGYRTLWVWPSDGHDAPWSRAVAVAWRREDHLDADQTRRQAMARLARVAGLVFERVRSEEVTAHAATHDALTGLANRARFYEVLGSALAAPVDEVGVIYIDLDGFKPVNDEFGHGVGDAVLVEVARRIDDHLPAGVTVARLGGDEFAVVVPVTSSGQLDALARELVSALSEPIDVGRLMPVQVGASAGIAIAGPGVDPDALIEEADAALYSAKRAGGGLVRTSASIL